MLKYVVVLCIGLAAGYSFGFKDGKEHDEGIVTRSLERVGGSARGKYSNDVDNKLEKLEQR